MGDDRQRNPLKSELTKGDLLQEKSSSAETGVEFPIEENSTSTILSSSNISYAGWVS